MGMPKGDKYIGLTRFLEKSNEDKLTLSFAQIESLIGDSLPLSAKVHRAFWSNTKTHSVAYGWMNANYRTIDVDLGNELITFKKS
ncbi:hypothetical protein SAMN05660462_00534 [Proteiniborus ethanoligenes]|uniref:DUF7662 domain-containing protein n=1 Tax=Proteiniborus ethanoligenes TaxID=415015 RepID=A0A1H3LGQ0_9FIRM|nr:hypothetical protein [Proteiniborus ethanoligenes]SDY63496.1 hypothetical protein SAMN05660462_00534 [Proteiniborus ethanoligenes]